jgi:RNA polymerase sigma-70 factor (ECF subfamily)
MSSEGDSVAPVAGDEALLEAFRERSDEGALDELVRRHWEPALRIARAIVRDDALAQDAAQEAFVRLAATRTRIEALGPWLRATVANEAKKQLRGRRRRERRERAAARPEEAVTETSLLEYVEALPENHRVAIVLHYGAGLSHAEVAETLGCPKPTASTWIRRGLDELKATLGVASVSTLLLSESLGRSVRAAAPAPSARRIIERARLAAKGSALVAALAAKKVVAATCALLLAGLVATLVASTSDKTIRAPSRAASAAPVAPASSLAVETPREDARPATPVSSRAALPPDTPDTASVATAVLVQGRILDEAGKGIPGARVWFTVTAAPEELGLAPLDALPPASVGPERFELFASTLGRGAIADFAETTTDAEGAYTLVVPRRTPEEAWTCVCALGPPGTRLAGAENLSDVWDNASRDDVVLELLPFVTVTATVRANGAPVAGATVETKPHAPHFELELTLTADRAGSVAFPVHPRPYGSGEKDEEPLELKASHEGFATTTSRLVLPEHDLEARIDLVPATVIEGRVLDPEGHPVSSATVVLGREEVIATEERTTDDRGSFRFDRAAAGTSYELTVVGPDLALLSTRVSVVAPCALATVSLARAAEVVASVQLPPGFAFASDEDRSSFFGSICLARAHAARDESSIGSWSNPHLGPDGTLRYEGVSPGDYCLVRESATPGQRIGLAPGASAPFSVAAGEREVHARFEAAPSRPVSGRCVLRDGKPAQGVLVHAGRQSVLTGNDGRFSFGDLPVGEEVSLTASVAPLGEGDVNVAVPPGATSVADVVVPHPARFE